MMPKAWKAPIEVKIVSAMLLGIALVWGLVWLIPVIGAGASTRTFLLPVTALVLGGLVVAGLALKMPSSRLAGFVVTVVFALLHAFILLGAELWFIKVASGLAFFAYGYSFVLLNSMPLKRHVLGVKA
ncbi:hypothetical protein [Amycolatopsis sp. H20-H5]|uniref:hypothetical protein n=1 Tax=Amycolatopsis sp. H20-H5 TaxID=3046309 RepID=UPI002DBFBB40|nr:hypothetical protein [Amycolatopsis sp. H20-H5]MEC3980049.1 hypothetical protein [Amycolatopsis sp. H20-H5]